MKLIATLLYGWLFMCIAGSTLAAPTMDITDGWVREAPPTSRVLAAYMQIINLTDSELTVTGITSPDFEAAELHRTVVENGMARMLPVPELTIPAGGSITLAPGGLHLMLMMPAGPLPAGSDVPLEMTAADGRSFRLSLRPSTTNVTRFSRSTSRSSR